MPPLDAIYVFVRIAESKSLTAAAQRLGISPAAASKSLSRLEERLGARLMNRTTRTMSLTDDGALFFERCRHILADLEDAEAVLTRRQIKPRGRLRVLVPVGFGRAVLVPLLASFAELHDELTMDVELSDRVVNLADEGVDVVIWNGHRRDSSVVAKKLCHVHYVTVASPQYLTRWGEPSTPADLQNHRCLGYFFPHANRYREWNFVFDGKPVAHHVSGSLNINNGPALLDAAISGAGIAVVATFLASDAVREGRLNIILRDFISPGPTFWIGYLARRNVSPRVRALVDFLTARVPAKISEDSDLRGEPVLRAVTGTERLTGQELRGESRRSELMSKRVRGTEASGQPVRSRRHTATVTFERESEEEGQGPILPAAASPRETPTRGPTKGWA